MINPASHSFRIFYTLCLVLAGMTLFAQNDSLMMVRADSLKRVKKYDEALSIYTKILKQRPNEEKALAGRGSVYMARLNYTAAEQDLKQALTINKNCFSCYMNLAAIRFSRKELIAADEFISKAMKIDSLDPSALVLRARIRWAGNFFDEADAIFGKVIEIDKKYFPAWFYRGLLRFEREKYEDGANDMSAVISIDSTVAEAWFRRGIYFANNQKWEDALRDFNKAASIDTANSGYVTNIAAVYLYKEDPATAYKYYDKAVRLNPSNLEALYYKSVAAYRTEDMELGCSCLRAMEKKIPAKPTEEDLHWKDEMTAQLKEYCDSSFSGYYYQRGIASYNKNKFTEAIQWYDRGLEKFPAHFMMTNFRGNANLALGKNQEAEDDYTTSLALVYNIENELEAAGSYDGATAEEKKMYKESVIASTYQSRAEARVNLGMFKEAEADIETGIKMMPAEMPGKETLYNARGILYLINDDPSNALSFLNKAIQANAAFVPGYINRAIVKMNLAYRTKVINRNVSIANNNLNASFDLPTLKKIVVKKDNLEAALSDCNKALQLDNKNGLAYQVRATIKILLGEGDFCYDLLKAEQLGEQAATQMIIDNKCR